MKSRFPSGEFPLAVSETDFVGLESTCSSEARPSLYIYATQTPVFAGVGRLRSLDELKAKARDVRHKIGRRSYVRC